MIEIKLGVENVGGDTAFYYNLLGLYLSELETKKDLVPKLFSEKDYKNFVIETHSLKSSSLLLGALAMSEASKRMESFGKNEEILALQTSIECYVKLMNNTADFIKNNYLSEIQNSNPQQLFSGLLEKIKDACEILDYQAAIKEISFLSNLKLTDENLELKQKIMTFAQNEEFEEILELINKFKA